MDNVISLDMERNLGTVTLSSGEELPIPRLSVSKIIKIIKFVAMDGAKLYGKIQDVALDEQMDDMEKLIAIMDNLEDEQLVRLFSILLDLPDKVTLSLDINEMLEIALVYAEKVDFNKTFLLIRKLAKVTAGKELPPTFGEWMKQLGAGLNQNGPQPLTESSDKLKQ